MHYTEFANEVDFPNGDPGEATWQQMEDGA